MGEGLYDKELVMPFGVAGLSGGISASEDHSEFRKVPKLDKDYVLSVLPNAYTVFSRYGAITNTDVIGTAEDGYEIVFTLQPATELVLTAIPKRWEFVPVNLCFVGAPR